MLEQISASVQKLLTLKEIIGPIVAVTHTSARGFPVGNCLGISLVFWSGYISSNNTNNYQRSKHGDPEPRNKGAIVLRRLHVEVCDHNFLIPSSY